MGRFLELADAVLRECDKSDLCDQRLHGTPIADLRTLAGDDWPEIERNPDLLAAFANAVQTRRMRERCEVPAHYTATTTCKHCGLVHIFPGVPDRVDGCPWCFNRVKGLPVPEVTP